MAVRDLSNSTAPETLSRRFAECAIVATTLVLGALLVHAGPSTPLSDAFAPMPVAVVIGLGAAGAALQNRIGVPPMLGGGVPVRDRWTLPWLLGAAFGLATMVEACLTTAESGAGVPLPAAVLVFFVGAVLLEVFLRQGALTLLAAAGHSFGPWTFWLAATLVALYEPLPYLDVGSGSSMVTAVRLLVFNLVGAWHYRRAGLLAALNLRWSEYLVWHVVGQGVLGL